jgi:hypothetical protein
LLLAGKLANEPDGTWVFSPQEKLWIKNSWNVKQLVHGGHGHGHGIGLVAPLEYALAVNDRVRAGQLRMGEGEQFHSIGFFPEWFLPHYDRCEMDTIADMLALALNMSAAGVADYWNDADRWIRNHFSESQLTSADWAYRFGGAIAAEGSRLERDR